METGNKAHLKEKDSPFLTSLSPFVETMGVKANPAKSSNLECLRQVYDNFYDKGVLSSHGGLRKRTADSGDGLRARGRSV